MYIDHEITCLTYLMVTIIFIVLYLQFSIHTPVGKWPAKPSPTSPRSSIWPFNYKFWIQNARFRDGTLVPPPKYKRCWCNFTRIIIERTSTYLLTINLVKHFAMTLPSLPITRKPPRVNPLFDFDKNSSHIFQIFCEFFIWLSSP